jgi:hypothetical protein
MNSNALHMGLATKPAMQGRPLYGGNLAYLNETIPVIEPPRLPHHDRHLYQIFEEETNDDQEDETTRLERVTDERDVTQAVSDIENLWRRNLINGYRQDPIYKLACDSSKTQRGGQMQHYQVADGLVYTTTRNGGRALYIPKGHGSNSETLQELCIGEIHNKGHNSAERNLRYATEYIYWPEMRRDFSDYIKQCELCQINKERNALPTGEALALPFPSEIFSSYAIDFMGPFTKLKQYNTVLVVVDRAVGFSWLIPTSSNATALETMELLRHYVFTPHGVPTSIISDADLDSPLDFGSRL